MGQVLLLLQLGMYHGKLCVATPATGHNPAALLLLPLLLQHMQLPLLLLLLLLLRNISRSTVITHCHQCCC